MTNCKRCGGTEQLMDRAMMPGETYCIYCRQFFSERENSKQWRNMFYELIEFVKEREPNIIDEYDEHID